MLLRDWEPSRISGEVQRGVNPTFVVELDIAREVEAVAKPKSARQARPASLTRMLTLKLLQSLIYRLSGSSTHSFQVTVNNGRSHGV